MDEDDFNFDDFFGFDEDFAKIIKKLMSSAFNNIDNLGEPVVYGINLRFDKDGKPIIEEFGNVKNMPGGTKISDIREPLVDIIEKDDELEIVAEVPGAKKEDIKVSATQDYLTISAKREAPETKYFKRIKLPAKVDPSTAKAKYNNGILQVNIKKKESKAEGKEIKVE